MNILDALWREADVNYRALLERIEAKDLDQSMYLKGRLRGLCFALLPFYRGGAGGFQSEDDIAREIVARHKLGVYDNEQNPKVPGNRMFEGPPSETKPNAPRMTPSEPSYKVSDADLEKIKTSTFPVDLLADIYKLSVSQVEAIQKS